MKQKGLENIMMRHLVPLLLSLVSPGIAFGQTYTITTVPGSVLPLNSLLFPDGDATYFGPTSVAVDTGGNLFFPVGQIVMRLDAKTDAVTVAAGGGMATPGNGPAINANLNPQAVAVDSAGNLYIADDSTRIRKVSNGVITTVAGNGTTGFSGDGGPATSAQLNGPLGIAVDSGGNLYIADTNNRRIREVTNGVITTIAGSGNTGFGGDNGPATAAQLSGPRCVAVDSAGNVYIADTDNQRVRKVSNGVITTVAGGGTSYPGDNGPATSADIGASGVAVDSAGNLYIADDSTRIRKVSNGVITTVAGNGISGLSGDGGPATSGEMNHPNNVVVGSSDGVFVADYLNGRIRFLNPSAVPSINLNGIVPVYSSVPVIQSDSWVSIYGKYLADGTYLWNNDFPTNLGTVTVSIDKKPAYLWFVSPTQINLQVPEDTTTGVVNVAVNTPLGIATSTVTLAQYAPSFSLLGDGKHVAGVILTPDGNGAYAGGTYDLVGPLNTFSFNTRPVQQGETLILYGVGFGPTTPHVPAGQAFTGITSTNNPVTITIGGVLANVSFSGITEAGLYQFNLTVPPSTGQGDQPLQATVNGIQTPGGPVVAVQ
jgi:uncharacterized protein (TIGR03437 family)